MRWGASCTNPTPTIFVGRILPQTCGVESLRLTKYPQSWAVPHFSQEHRFQADKEVASMIAQVANGVAEEARSDLAQLWHAAVEEYEEATGQSLRMGGFKSMDDVMKGTEGIYIKFRDFRDDASKVARVRRALKNNMWLIQNIIHIVQSTDNVASVCLEISTLESDIVQYANHLQAFPLAMPASLIFAVFGQVMQV